jgi:molybdenum cofactor cytidylyltransferase
MLSSVQCGLRNLPSDFSAVLVFQGDQPFIKASVINEVIGEYISTGKGMVIPVFNGKRGHPLLVDRKYNEEIFKLSVDRGLRELTFKFPEDVSEVNTNEPDILRDLDTHKQYLKIINQIK